MAEAITLPGSNGSSLWSKVLRLMAPLPLGSLYVPEAKEGGKLIANRTTKCTWCAWDKNDKTRTPTVGDCQWPGNDNGALNSATCNASVPDATAPLGRACPKGMGLCRSSAFGSARKSDYSPNLPSGGNSQSIPCGLYRNESFTRGCSGLDCGVRQELGAGEFLYEDLFSRR